MVIKEAKIEALRKALSQGSPEDPWCLAYKLITSKKKGAATAWTTIQDSEGNWAGNRKMTQRESRNESQEARVERRPGQRDYPTGTQEDRPGETEEGAGHRWFSNRRIRTSVRGHRRRYA
jgi:hypothetical protein